MPNRHDAPGGNYRGKRQADAKECPGASGRLEVVAAAGVLVRHIALARKGTSLSLPAHSRPEIPRGSSKTSRTLGNHRAGQILARGRVPGRNRVTGNPFRLGVGIMAARSPARYGLVACPACYSLLL